ncbi:DEAD/DEAH box helicase [Marivirga sp.]|uniref:DEAD/DEAH box helicase n=1 Tax=Marivirga sp. TaxID=2018662 RepID=UPI0025E34B8A|nr:AAA domain-containing protein [Marivirga sp.]
MKEFDVWKSYIDVLEILTNQYSEPFDIKVLEVKNDSSVICRYIDDNHREKIFENLVKVFPELRKNNLNYQGNYLLYPSKETICTSELEALKVFSESNHFEFSSKPAFSGTFKYNNTPLIDFLKKHVIKTEELQSQKTLVHHLKMLYPGSTWKEKNRGKIVVLDETFLHHKTFEEWGLKYSIEYILTIKDISYPIEVQITSSKILEISHSIKKKKLSVKLKGSVTEKEIKEIRTLVNDDLCKKLGQSPTISLNAVFTKTNFQDTIPIPITRKFNRIQFLTLDELDRIDKLLEQNGEVSREEKIGAISKIDVSEKFIQKQYIDAEKFLKDKVGITPFKVEGFFKQIHLKNTFLKKVVFDDFQKSTFYSSSFHLVSYIIDPIEFETFEAIRKSKRIYYRTEDESSLEGVILPNPDKNVFIQTFSAALSLGELKFEILIFLNTLKRYFRKEKIQIAHEQILRLDKQRFLEHIKDVIPNEDFQISSDAETIAFDFRNRVELSDKLQKLRTYESLRFLGFKEDHKFKVAFEKNTPLEELKIELDKFNFAKSILKESGNVLRVFGLMSDISLLPIVKANIENAVGNYEQKNIQLNWDSFDDGYIKYFFRFDEDSYKEEVYKKLNNLRGEPLSRLESRDSLGVLKAISYPNLTIQAEDNSLLKEGEYLCVKSALKGEKDKIKRLRDTIEKIYSVSDNSILNKQLKTALIDSSTLESFIDGDITLTNDYKDLYQKINNDLLSTYVNERQKAAIVKCLLSEDLFIVQGPPGTGKSTAIAELIWQHLVNNEQEARYRVLVTSETNLAVDNALDKLRSKSHLLMKPIRFGSEGKLDTEGRRFSLEALNSWKNQEWEDEEPLIVDDWIDLINSRCENPLNNSFINQWKEHLTEKNIMLRDFVHKSYVNNCNVIGATCSSIGKTNSEGKFTRFFQEYSNVFYPDVFESFKSLPSRSSATNLKKKEIEFELAIQDEASKASPPELVLPFTFAKKAVIIGDHRQLPPLIDSNEFIESLIYLKNKSKDEKQIKKISDLIRFIKQHKQSFEQSQFEKLFKNIDLNLKSTFDTQYRMHPAINETIKQFYKGDFEDGKDLECGLPLESVDDPDLNNSMSRYHGLTKKKDTHVMWFDVQTPEIKQGTSRINPGEVTAIEWIINSITSNENYSSFINHWKDNEREQKELGVITFYGAQAGLIKRNIPEGVEVRVSPVDKFQGMERNIVIVSLVRSNNIAESENEIADFHMYPQHGYPQNESLGFAESPNRLNVALSRAKRLLIVVGNSKHFSKKEIYKNVFETIKAHPQGEVWGFDGEKPFKI